MRIKAVKLPQLQGGRVTLVFDDDSVMKVLPVVAAEQNLYEGKELDEAALLQLKTAASIASAKNRAVRIISTTGVSKNDLKRRLVQKGETPADAEQAVTWLNELNLLDDAQIAQQIVARCVARGYGRARIRQQLYAKQIPREYWDEALSAVPEMDDTLDCFLQQRFHGCKPERKELQKAIDALMRRGHSWQDIKAALNRYGASTEAFSEE